MRLWTADKKFMWYGFSGYHYQVTLSCPRSREVAADRVRDFYLARRGIIGDAPVDGHFKFSRGKRPWSWIMPSEARQPQTIAISFSQQAEITNIAIDYHVTNRFGLLIKPCMFDREIAKLREELEKP